MSDKDGEVAAMCGGARVGQGQPGRLPTDPNPSIAVVGSGPSGCYVAQFLARAWPEADITVFEQLPTPYGLIRYGVAPDHQGSKAVTAQFDRLFTTGGVRFAGNVTVGRDIEFELLSQLFDIVVLATGLPKDRKLDVLQAADARVIGAGELLRALNGHPHAMGLTSGAGHGSLGRRLVVVGMGNVAIDVVRLLSKTPIGLVGSDIDDRVHQQLLPEPPVRIEVLSRSSAAQAKCDVSMLREVLSAPNIIATATGVSPQDDGPVAELLHNVSDGTTVATSKKTRNVTRIVFRFCLAPERIEATAGQGSRIYAVSEDGHRRICIDADTVVTAIGFTHGAADDHCSPVSAWSGAHVYRVGWLSRGSKGTIADNRKQARAVAEMIVDDVRSGRISCGRPGFSALELSPHARVVTFDRWQRIDDFELSAAPPDRCRRKITDVDHMLAVAGFALGARQSKDTAEVARDCEEECRAL